MIGRMRDSTDGFVALDLSADTMIFLERVSSDRGISVEAVIRECLHFLEEVFYSGSTGDVLVHRDKDGAVLDNYPLTDLFDKRAAAE